MSNESQVDKLKVTISQATRMVNKLCKVGLVPMIHGSPALGKSAIAKEIARRNNLILIDLRLSQCEPTDLLGLPAINHAIQRSGYMPMDSFPLKGDGLPMMLDENGNGIFTLDDDGKKVYQYYNGWLLFLDEFNSAERQTQAAAYKVILDRMIGMFHMHEKVFPLCAGNLETDGAIVEAMSTAMQSRLCHLEVYADHKEWCEWAIANGIDNRIVSFIEFMPKYVYNFRADHNDRTYSSPRTLEFAHKWMNEFGVQDEDARPALSGILGHGVAAELISFCNMYDNLPKIKDIISNPKGTRVPDETDRGLLFATCGAISHHATVENIPQLLEYVSRFPKDMQIVAARMIVMRNKDVLTVKEFILWYTQFAQYLFKT